MKRFSWLAWSVMVSVGAVASLAACGDDDDGPVDGADSGTDSGQNQLPDANSNQADGTTGAPDTGKPDVHVPDSGSDAHAPDGGDAGDAGDSGIHDAGDAGDAGVDSGKPDAGDAGVDSGTCGKTATGGIGSQMPRGANVLVPSISYQGCSGSTHAVDKPIPPAPAGSFGTYSVSVTETVNGFFRITGGDVHTTLSPEINGAIFGFVDPMLPLLPFGMATPSFNAAKAHIGVFYGQKNNVDRPCSAYNATVVLNAHPEAVLKFVDEDGNVLASPPDGAVDTWALYTNVDPAAGFATFTFTPNDPVKCMVTPAGLFTGRIPIEANAVSYLPTPPLDKKKN